MGDTHATGDRETPTAAHQETPRGVGRLHHVVLAMGAAVLGGTLVVGALGADPPLLAEVRASLEVLTGVLFFGAGLLQLSIWRFDRESARGHVGLALVVLGFLTPRITALGPLLHEDAAARVLSPWTATVVAVLALTLGVAGPTRLDRFAGGWRTLVAGCGALLLALLYLPLLLRRGLPFTLDVPLAAHLLLELGVAALWLTAAVRLAHRRREPQESVEPRHRPVVQAEHLVVAAMGGVWVLRAVAVVAVQPWALAAGVLMAVVGAAALAGSAHAFAEVSEARDRRVADVEEALAAAAHTLTELDVQRRTLRHDARNTLFALNAAAQVLAEHGGDLDVADRRRLRDAVRGELAQLEVLLGTPVVPAQRNGLFDVGRESA